MVLVITCLGRNIKVTTLNNIQMLGSDQKKSMNKTETENWYFPTLLGAARYQTGQTTELSFFIRFSLIILVSAISLGD